MRIHPTVTHVNGVVSVSLQAQFVGDSTDTNDRALMASYGDPEINIAGLFVDPLDTSFRFELGAPTLIIPVVKELHNHPVQFMTSLPLAPTRLAPIQGPTQVITPDPVRAAMVWRNEMNNRITLAFQRLREFPNPITSLPDTTI